MKRFQGTRREDVEKTQYAANVSALSTENPARYWRMEPVQACFSMLTRAKAVTFRQSKACANAQFVEQGSDTGSQGTVRDPGLRHHNLENPPPPMFTPFRVGNMVVAEPRRSVADEYVLGRAGRHSRAISISRISGASAWAVQGLVFAEMTAVSERQGKITPGCPGIYSDEQVVAWKRISDFIHKQSPAKFCLQLGHSGRKGSTKLGWVDMDHPLDDGNWDLVAASPLAFHDSCISRVKFRVPPWIGCATIMPAPHQCG